MPALFPKACCALREMSHEASCTSGSTNRINPCGVQYSLTSELLQDPNCCVGQCIGVQPGPNFNTEATVTMLTQKGTFDPIQLSDVCCCEDALFRRRNWLELELDYVANADLRVALHVESKQPTGPAEVWSYPSIPALTPEPQLVRVPFESRCINQAALSAQCCSTRASCCPRLPAGPLAKAARNPAP